MNRSRMLLLAVLALTLSAIVTVGIYRTLRTRLSTPDEFVPIVVAAEKLPIGSSVSKENLTIVRWPKAVAVEGAFRSIDEVVGRGVVVPIYTNEPVLEVKLAPKGAGSGLTTIIPDGMRAVAVKVDDVIGVAGFVVPGTHVDVIVSGSMDGSNRTDTSKVILEDVQVLAAGQNVEQSRDGKPQNVQVITLVVTPEDSQKLALASVDGKLHLSLRNPLDAQHSNPSPVNKLALYSEPVPPRPPRPIVAKRSGADIQVPAPVPAEVPHSRSIDIELIQGTTTKTLTFEIKPKQ